VVSQFIDDVELVDNNVYGLVELALGQEVDPELKYK
jgi:hypothetical protein